jgi:hypothetical protein
MLGLALSGLLWAAAVVLTGTFLYSALAPRQFCDGTAPRSIARDDTTRGFDWPPPLLRCPPGEPLPDGETEAEREWETYWDWPQLAFLLALDALALADRARRVAARRRRLRARRGSPSGGPAPPRPPAVDPTSPSDL